MKNKYLEVFKELERLLDFYPSESDDYDFLKIILERRLKNLDENNGDGFVPDRISRKTIYAIFHKKSLDAVDSRDANKEVKVDKLRQLLDEFVKRQIDSKSNFRTIGFRPILEFEKSVGGRGKDSLLWLNIAEYHFEEQSDEIDSATEIANDIFKINYSRKNIDEIKPSLFTKIIFTNSELKMRSIKGIAVMLFFMSGLLVEFLLLVFAFIMFLLIRDLKTLKLWELLVFCSFIPMAYLSWVGLFRPLHNLLTHRIIKAPELFLNANIDNADIEMYKGKDGYKVARVTEFIATCPICSAPIELADGKPDQKAPLVGRCREAPHAHVYSFDRVTLKGFFLGHEGYLEDNLELTRYCRRLKHLREYRHEQKTISNRS